MGAAAMGGGALGNLTQLGNQSVAFGISRQQQSDSWDQWKRSLKKGKVYEMEGLRRAGINPIIAAGGTFLGGTAKALLNQPNAAGAGAPGRNAMIDAAGIKQATNAANLSEQLRINAVAQGRILAADARYRESADGMKNYHRFRTNEALPNTIPGIFSKGWREMTEDTSAKQIADDFKPYIGPSKRRGTPDNPWTKKSGQESWPQFGAPSGK